MEEGELSADGLFTLIRLETGEHPLKGGLFCARKYLTKLRRLFYQINIRKSLRLEKKQKKTSTPKNKKKYPKSNENINKQNNKIIKQRKKKEEKCYHGRQQSLVSADQEITYSPE